MRIAHSSNKYSDGSIKLNGSLYETNSRLLCSWMDLLECEKFPGVKVTDDEDKESANPGSGDEAGKRQCHLETDEFNWYSGTVLSGGSVVDEVEQKVKLLTAAENRGIDDVVGGEMEGSGIYFACDREKIPCIVIKGICDWGVNKNAWDEILKGERNPPDNQTVKDCIQALSFSHAFSALRCLLEYDNTMIEENYGMQDAADLPTIHLSNMNSLKRSMMKISTVNFLPYFFLGTVCILISFLWEPVLFKLFHNEIFSENLGNKINPFLFIYGGSLYIGAIVWIIENHLRTRPENLKLVFADISFKNLSFEKCCCILENVSKAELYSMSIGWICKTQLSPVKIHKCKSLSSRGSLLVTSQNCIHNPGDILVSKMPEDFCFIIPDTLQINYRMPNGDSVVHIISKAPRKITKQENLEKGEFCTRYSEQILIYRDGIYEEVLKRICYGQIIL